MENKENVTESLNMFPFLNFILNLNLKRKICISKTEQKKK